MTDHNPKSENKIIISARPVPRGLKIAADRMQETAETGRIQRERLEDFARYARNASAQAIALLQTERASEALKVLADLSENAGQYLATEVN